LQVGPYDGYAFRPDDGKPLPFTPNQPSRWRLLVRTGHAELYVNDELIQCYTFAHAPGGQLGFVIEAGAAPVRNVRAGETHRPVVDRRFLSSRANTLHLVSLSGTISSLRHL